MTEIDKLKKENVSLRETCEILADKNAVKDIKKSLKEVSKGDFITISQL